MNLLRFLKKNKNARKIFGKRELKIIEKQILGLKLTQSERNRLSRDIRPKLEFVKDIADFKNEFRLKHGVGVKALIEETKEEILESKYFSRIKRILLFGSYIEKKVHFGSDIDLAVDFDKINLKEATKFRLFIQGRVSNKIDVQVYNVLPEKIKKEIRKNHKILYEK